MTSIASSLPSKPRRPQIHRAPADGYALGRFQRSIPTGEPTPAAVAMSVRRWTSHQQRLPSSRAFTDALAAALTDAPADVQPPSTTETAVSAFTSAGGVVPAPTRSKAWHGVPVRSTPPSASPGPLPSRLAGRVWFGRGSAAPPSPRLDSPRRPSRASLIRVSIRTRIACSPRRGRRARTGVPHTCTPWQAR